MGRDQVREKVNKQEIGRGKQKERGSPAKKTRQRSGYKIPKENIRKRGSLGKKLYVGIEATQR